jgi:dTMP kinase
MDMQGRIIVIEGSDGSGKSTLCANLAEALRMSQGAEVLEIREPGGCELGEHIRGILKGTTVPGALTDPRAEALLFAAARAELTSTVIRPALERGAFIICDRGVDSSLIYQGLARGLSVDAIREISLFANDNLHVDRVLALQVSAGVAQSRMHERDGAERDRIEEDLSAETLREGYARLKELSPYEVVEISAEGTPDEVLALCLEAIEDLVS